MADIVSASTLSEGLRDVSVDHAIKDIEDPTTLYHYTSMKGLCGILESRCMWASHANYLNDPREQSHGPDIVKQFLRERIPLETGIPKGLAAKLEQVATSRLPIESFALSLTEEGDLLSQWRGYGDAGRGVAIGLSFEALRGCLDKMRQEKVAFDLDKVEYENTKKKDRLGRLFDHWIAFVSNPANSKGSSASQDDNICDLANAFVLESALFKHDGFSEEKEWRMDIWRHALANLPIKTHVSNNQVIPHIEVPLTIDSDTSEFVTAIENITVGPTLDFRKTEYALRCLLNEQGIRRVKEKREFEDVPIFESGLELSA